MWNIDPGGSEPSRDLPLLSNTADIRVRHYLIDLAVDFTCKTFHGSVMIFLEPASEKEKQDGVSLFAPETGSKQEVRRTEWGQVDSIGCSKEIASMNRASSESRRSSGTAQGTVKEENISLCCAGLEATLDIDHGKKRSDLDLQDARTDCEPVDGVCVTQDSTSMNSSNCRRSSNRVQVNCDDDDSSIGLCHDQAADVGHTCLSRNCAEPSKDHCDRLAKKHKEEHHGKVSSNEQTRTKETDCGMQNARSSADENVCINQTMQEATGCSIQSTISSELLTENKTRTREMVSPGCIGDFAIRTAPLGQTASEGTTDCRGANFESSGLDTEITTKECPVVCHDYWGRVNMRETLSQENTSCKDQPVRSSSVLAGTAKEISGLSSQQLWSSMNLDIPRNGSKQNIITKRKSRHQKSLECDVSWFTCVLDCCDIDVEKVEEVNVRKCESELNQSTDDSSKTNGSVNGSAIHKENHEYVKNENKPKLSDSEVVLSNLLGYDRCNFDERNRTFESYRHLPGEALSFRVDDWCLRIWKEGVTNVSEFPAVIRIVYMTRPRGQSFTWAFDQAGRNCVFTQGAWINNRSLFPCQEPPGAMATWQAFIQAPAEYVVLMSGDEEAQRKTSSNGSATSYYFVNMVMPPSMLALAIGQWQGAQLSTEVGLLEGDQFINIRGSYTDNPVPCRHEPWLCRISNRSQRVIPSRVFAPEKILASAKGELEACIPRFLAASFMVLGPHPFARLDFVIMPYCFASMGLASPSIVFISNTLVAGDGSLVARLAHEISHSWFGLLIGAMDWTEEWLSEGFATFLEDPLQALAERWTKVKFLEVSNLRAFLRYRALRAEIKNTAAELQIMRPMGDQSHMKDALQAGYVKNGQHPDKWFLQVHYLKGYFLLHYIADLVGLEPLLRVMAVYVSTYHGQLVLSQEFFKLLFAMCPVLLDHGITPESIDRDWLDSPGMPKLLEPERFTRGNRLINQVIQQVETWKAIDSYHRRRDKVKLKKKLKITCPVPDLNLIPEQICLLLETLGELDILHVRTLAKLREDFRLSLRNAEIRHRWCELVIKHRYLDGYGDIRMFLLKNQSMGVYLYGELLASEDPVQRLLAETCYEAVATFMDRGCRRTVEEMMGLDQNA